MKVKILSFLLITGILLLSSCQTEEPLPKLGDEFGSIDPAVDIQIEKLVEEGEIPSLAVGVVVNDALVWAKGYGEQPDLSTIYMIGSIDKAFIGTAVLQLYEQGLIDLDTDINTYLPFNVRHPDYPEKAITVHMLLTHKSGLIHDFPDGFYYENDQAMLDWASKNLDIDLNDLPPDPQKKFSRDEYLRSYFETDPQPQIWATPPGSTLQYSNIGFHWLLSYIVEQITSQSIEEYIQQNILNPLGMQNTSYNAADFASDQLAIPYVRFEDGYQALPITGMSATGRIRMTATDLTKFMRVHMNQGESNGVQILQPETVDLMHNRHIPMNGHDFPGMKLYGSGYGWWLWEDGLQGHGGAVPGFYAQMLYKQVDDGTHGLVMMMNTGCSLVPCDNEWFDKYYITIRALLLQEADKLHMGSAETSSEPIDTSADNPIYASYYQDWWTYTNAIYGFSLLVPPNWIVDEAASAIPLLRGHLRNLRPQDVDQKTGIRSTFRRVGEDIHRWSTGVGEGEFVDHGMLEAAGESVHRILLVCPTGEIGAIWYQGESLPEIQLGDLDFAFIYSYRDVDCQEGYSLDGKVRQQGERILAAPQVL